MPRLGLGLGLAKGSVLYSFFGTIISNFISRVTADSGTFEAQTCLQNYLNSLGQNLYDKASLLITPNAYKAAKIYALKPTNGSGDLTFARASARTRRNSSGAIESIANNVPALEYPVGGGCPAWSFEPQRTKVWKQSNNIASASYTRIGVVALDAETIAEDTSTGSHVFLQIDAGVVTGSRYTWSAKIKANGRSRIEIRDNATGGGSCFIDLSNGTKWSPDSIGVSRITPDTDGYYFIEFSFTATSTANYNINIRLKNASNADSYTGDGVSGIKIKDIGFEEGAYATSFLQTTTASVTRIEDGLSLSGISSQIGQTAGVVFIDASFPELGSNFYFSINDGTTNNRVGIGMASSNVLNAFITSGGVSQASISSVSTVVVGTRYKIAAVYDVNYFALFVNGVKIGEDLSVNTFAASVGVLSRGTGAGSGRFFGQLFGLLISNTRLSDAECITLTTL